MKINVNECDIVITCKNGFVHLWENGKEITTIQAIKFEASLDETPKLSTTKVVSNKKNEIYNMKESEVLI